MRNFVSLLTAIALLCAVMPASAGSALDNMNFDDLQADLNTNLILVADDAGGGDSSKPKVSTLPYNAKNPWLAGGLSLVIPGAGQMYNDQYFLGGMLLAAEIALYMGAFAYSGAFTAGERFSFQELKYESIFLLALAGGLHLFGVYDAITEAQRINENLDKWNVAVAPIEEGVSVAYCTRW